MGYVLTWPSDFGPCMLVVSHRVFAERMHQDLHAERSYGVLRYPPPSWVRVVERRDCGGVLPPTWVLLLLALLVGFFAYQVATWSYRSECAADSAPAVPLQQAAARLLV